MSLPPQTGHAGSQESRPTVVRRGAVTGAGSRVSMRRAITNFRRSAGDAGAACDRLAEILGGDGFEVERPDGGHPSARAVAVRFSGGRPGRTLQFNGHLDTVHLPFVPPRVQNGQITGSGASDMK